jgi:signal peptidase II
MIFVRAEMKASALTTPLAALAVFALDRASKIWIVEVLSLDTRYHIPVWPPYLNLTMAWNTGINFGLFGSGSEGARLLLVAIALVLVTAVGLWAWRMAGTPARLSAGVLIGGALGNIWDRLQYGAVADFLNLSCCGIDNPFAFNLADAAIFAGAIGLILFTGKRQKTT